MHAWIYSFRSASSEQKRNYVRTVRIAWLREFSALDRQWNPVPRNLPRKSYVGA